MKHMSVKSFVEVEKGSFQRAVFDEHLEIVMYREVSVPYPFAYGFILNTLSDDGDEIDCYILTNEHLKAGTIIDCVPIGLLEQFEKEEVDCKIISLIESDDFRFEQEHLQQIKRFIFQIFKNYPEVEIKFGEYRDGDYAIEYINERTQRT
jgi:inorganic pyrophosphatase